MVHIKKKKKNLKKKKSPLGGFNSRMEKREERISEPAGRIIEIIQT